MSDLDKIYQKVILDEAKAPYHFEKIEASTNRIRAHNPICGDRFDLYVEEKEIFFHGFGCTISKASASLMIRVLEGKSNIEALESINNFLRSIEEKKEINNEALRVFEKTYNFTGRIDCIILTWKAMKKYLENED